MQCIPLQQGGKGQGKTILLYGGGGGGGDALYAMGIVHV